MPSGRASLWLILKALSTIRPLKSEVIIPAYTCPALVSAILKAGLKPVLADINLLDFGFDYEGLKKVIGRNTLAVVLVHLFGYPASIDNIYQRCKESGVFLIEDCAQAVGHSVPGIPEKKLGYQADAGFFSFGRGKPLSVLHGGIAVMGSENVFEVANEIYRGLNKPSRGIFLTYLTQLCLFNLFSSPYLYWIPERLPFLHLGETVFEPDFAVHKTSKFPKTLLSVMAGSLEREQDIREKNSSWYSTAFQGVRQVRKPPSSSFPYVRYPLLIEGVKLRQRILEQLRHHGMGAALFYPCPLNELSGLREVLRDDNTYPNSMAIANSLITLPVHSGVTQKVLDTVKAVVTQTANSSN
jgi:dTDP-4-amino-4,6-dideoxygalactose transaminase